MIDQARDIVAILSESGVQTRRERAAFVGKLRDEMGLTFGEIGRQLNVTRGRAHQLYALNKIFQRSANSPFACLSARTRDFLNLLARRAGLPENWEQHPSMINRVVHTLRNMERDEPLKFRNIGSRTLKEIEDFMGENGMSFMEAEEEDDDGIEPKEFSAPAAPDEAMQRAMEFLNQNGFIGQFKMWPKGTYPNEDPDYDFTMTVNNFMGDAWEEQWQAWREFGSIIASMGYEYDVSGQPGEQRTFHFFKFLDY